MELYRWSRLLISLSNPPAGVVLRVGQMGDVKSKQSQNWKAVDRGHPSSPNGSGGRGSARAPSSLQVLVALKESELLTQRCGISWTNVQGPSSAPLLWDLKGS